MLCDCDRIIHDLYPDSDILDMLFKMEGQSIQSLLQKLALQRQNLGHKPFMLFSYWLNNPLYFNLLESIQSVFKVIHNIVFYKSQIAPEYLRKMFRMYPSHMCNIFFYHCNIQDSLPRIIEKMPLRFAKRIKLYCDPFNNTSVKNLAKCSQLRLQYLLLGSTMITTDCARMFFKKKVHFNVIVYDQKGLNLTLFMRQLMKGTGSIMTLDNYAFPYLSLGAYPFEKTYSYFDLYLGDIAKCRIERNYAKHIGFLVNSEQAIAHSQLTDYFPRRTIQELSLVVSIEFFQMIK